MRSKLILLFKGLGALAGGLVVALTSTSSSAQTPHTEAHRAILKAHTQAREEDLQRQAERAIQEELQRRAERAAREVIHQRAEDRQKALDRDAERVEKAEAKAEKRAAEKRAEARAVAKKRAAEKAAEKKRLAKIRAAEAHTKKRKAVVVKAHLGGYMPVPSGMVIASFGDVGSWARYHTGMDFRAGSNTPVRAVLAGRVIYAGNSGDWSGNHVVIRHEDGKKTLYAHMSSLNTHAGAYLPGGSIIGRVGMTGRAFGPHLHLELYPQGVQAGDVYSAINPRPWLHAHGVKA